MKIINPSGTTISTWTHNSVATYTSIAYYYTIRTLPSVSGTYTFEATYNGVTCSKTFTVNCGVTEISQSTSINSVSIFPNPTSGKINLQSQKEIGTVTICNLLGETVFHSEIKDSNAEINIADLPKGIYILQAQGRNDKLVKE